MGTYVVNTQSQANGDHEVHLIGCRFFPSNHQSLGYHASCRTAVDTARRIYSRADGCAHCSPACHKR